MKFLEKAKNLIMAPFAKKKAEPENIDPEELQALNKEIALYFVDKLTRYAISPPHTPKNLSTKRWKGILNQIIWSWQHAYKPYTGRSTKHHKLYKLKLLIGFKLFVRYFKDII
jgi:hypothetical protein